MGEVPKPKERVEENESPVYLEDLLFDLESSLFSLYGEDPNDLLSKFTVPKTIENIEQALDELEKKFPKYPNIMDIRILLDDLKGDMENGRRLIFDNGFRMLGKILSDRIKSAGIKKESTAAMNDKRIKSLKALHVDPSYFVRSPNPNGQTVVLILQIHDKRGQKSESKRKAIESSQKGISADVISCAEKGFFKVLFDEGSNPSDRMGISNIIITGLVGFIDGVVDAKRQLGDKLEVRGIENPGFRTQSPEEIKERGPFRATVFNDFLAKNVFKESFRLKDKVIGMVLGAGHETNFNKANPLPISYLLALHGYDVVVVDHASKLIDGIDK